MERNLSRRAFTLVEVMISSGLVLMLLGLMMAVLFPLHGQAVRGQQRMQYSQSGIMLSQNLVRDLTNSALPATHLSSLTDRLELAIQPLDSIDTSSHQVWSSDWLCYRWTAADRSLLRWTARRELESTGSPAPLPLTQLQQMTSQPKSPWRTLSQSLKSLHLEISSQGWAKVECLFEGEGQRPVQVEWRQTFLLRNSAL